MKVIQCQTSLTPRSCWFSYDRPRKDGKPSQPWTHPVVLEKTTSPWERNQYFRPFQMLLIALKRTAIEKEDQKLPRESQKILVFSSLHLKQAHLLSISLRTCYKQKKILGGQYFSQYLSLPLIFLETGIWTKWRILIKKLDLDGQDEVDMQW